MFQNNITTTTLPQWVLMSSNQTDEDTTMVTISDSMLTSEESVELLCFFDTLWMCYTVIVANKKYDMRPIDININIDCSEYLQKRNIIDNFATSIISKNNESYNTEIVTIHDVDYENKIYTIEILNNNSGVPESDVYYCSLIIPMATFEQYLNSDKTLNINIAYTDESYPVM